MSATPQYKCYLNNEYLASTKHLEDAAVLVAAWSGGEVRYGHNFVLWTEGKEVFSAGESYDGAADIMQRRLTHQRELAQAKIDASASLYVSTMGERMKGAV